MNMRAQNISGAFKTETVPKDKYMVLIYTGLGQSEDMQLEA